jgi:hypothetical protein
MNPECRQNCPYALRPSSFVFGHPHGLRGRDMQLRPDLDYSANPAHLRVSKTGCHVTPMFDDVTTATRGFPPAQAGKALAVSMNFNRGAVSTNWPASCRDSIPRNSLAAVIGQTRTVTIIAI